MSLFDRLGKLAKFLTEQPNYQPVAEAGQRVPSAAYRPDAMRQPMPQNIGITRSNFASLSDIAKNVPSNPGGWNDSIDTLRLGAGRMAQGTVGLALDKTIGAIDRKTDGKLMKVLTSDILGSRSNWAFVRDLEANTSGMGLLAAIGIIGAGVGAAALAATVGLPAAAVGGALAVGSLAAGKLGREVSQEGLLGETAQRAGELAITEEGQNKYNFGRDVVKSGAKIVGWEEVAKTDKGIGAIAAGLSNLIYDFGTSGFIGAGKIVGGVAQQSLKAPIKPVEGGLINQVLESRNVKLTAKRIADETSLINKTVAGEQTKWTPLFNLLENNTPAVVAQRPEFRTVLGNDAAALLAGRTREEIGLALRAGIGDETALDKLKDTSQDLVNEINRLDGALEMSTSGGIYSLNFKGKVLAISPRFKNNIDAVQAEIDALRAKNIWVDDALKLDSQMQDRTVSPIAWVEKVKNDLAKERLARKTESTDLSKRETGFGNVMQTVYQKNPFSPLIRRVDRWMDDAPRNIVRFDDPLQGAERFRTGIRSATVAGAITPQDGVNLYNNFISARSNGEKYLIVEEYTKKIATGVAVKNGVPPGSEVLKAVLEEYDKQVKKNILLPAYEAASAGRAYMIKPNGYDVEVDPQLITQLANSAFLPDVKQWDRAFKRYAAKREGEADVPMSPAYAAIEAAEEFNVLWRGFTLMRGGYPGNIIRDSTIRVYGDNALFDTLKELSQSTVDKIVRSDNSVSNISNSIKGIGNPQRQEKKISNKILMYEASVRTIEKQLKDAGYNVNKPPKKAPKDPVVRENLKYLNQLQLSTAELRRQRDAIISGKISAPVGRDKTVRFYGEEFPAAFSGRFADITKQSIGGTADIIRALSYAQELAVQNVKKTRTGSSSILATVDESLHMQEWVTTLRDILGFDPAARMYMAGKSRKDIVAYLSGREGFGYMNEMGLRGIDAGLQYNKIKAIVDMFAPTKDIHKLVLANQVTPAALTKLFPDPAARPPVLTDLVRDNSPGGGNLSTAYKTGRDALRASVAWLSTKPTATLMFNPYFAVKYNRKLQTMVHIANVQGRKLTLEDKGRFEQTARSYAMKEFREKLNSFHRDMNYGGLINYMLAFFPAVIEQYRAYGRIALDNPDFLIKASQISMIPNQYLGAQEDSFGNEYVEVKLPLIGGPEGTTHRLPASWFNPFNPTGSPSIVSAGPGLSAIGNFVSKKMNVETAVTNWMLPFGTQEETGMLLLPNTIKRGAQAFQAQLLKSGPQLNKDTAKFLQQKRFDFLKENDGREPSGPELAELNEEAMADAVSLAWARFRNSGLLPAQPQYVTPLQPYIDSLFKAREADPINGEDRWIEENPEYFLLTRSLADNTSGLIPDKTSRFLVQKNPDFIRKLVATLGVENASVLGSIFNDDNYAFSSAANAWLNSNKIPGTEKFFKNADSALEAERSGVVNSGWNKYNKFVETVTLAIEESVPGRTAAKGYGKILFDKYKDAFIEQQKTNNNIWWNEWDNLGSISGSSRRNATVKALTMAASDPKLWKDLQKIPRWTNVVNYLNFRYDIYDELKRRKTTIDSPRARDLRNDVDEFVYNLRKSDLNFGKFYDRYFSRDTFDYVVEEN